MNLFFLFLTFFGLCACDVILPIEGSIPGQCDDGADNDSDGDFDCDDEDCRGAVECMEPSPQSCESICSNRACGDDGCGGVCGICDASELCDDEGRCCGSAELPSCVFEGMLPVPEGTFWMGCNETVDDACDSNESPYHEVYLDTFFMDVYEVTAGEFRACVDAGDCYYDNPVDSHYSTYVNGQDDHPMNYVTRSHASGYCKAQGKRLPTEAEWEKAARGSDGRKYPWGNYPDASCTHVVMPDDSGSWGCGLSATWPVGSKPLGMSPHGMHDMAGNVTEWTTDWFGEGYYAETPLDGWVNPKGPDSGTYRISRGSSFCCDDDTKWSRTSQRFGTASAVKRVMLGFRCALSINE